MGQGSRKRFVGMGTFESFPIMMTCSRSNVANHRKRLEDKASNEFSSFKEGLLSISHERTEDFLEA